MEIRCKYSGELFRVEHFNSFHFVNIHPIFYLTQRELIIRARDWSKQNWPETDNKLMFLALLKSTGEVTFTYPADPSPQLVLKNMPNLFKLVSEAEILDGCICLPKYNINADNRKLENISIWMNSWNEARIAWLNPITRNALRKETIGRENLLDRLMFNKKDTPEYANQLAQWAIKTALVPEELREYYISLFKLRGDELYSVRIDDLEKLYEHMQLNLFITIGEMGGYNPYARRTLEHLEELIKKAKGGKLGELSGGDFFSILEDYSDSTDNEGKPLQNIGYINARLAAIGAPECEPKKEDYKGNLLAYVKAKSAWVLSNALKKKAAERIGL
jgi:hypothetical protein